MTVEEKISAIIPYLQPGEQVTDVKKSEDIDIFPESYFVTTYGRIFSFYTGSLKELHPDIVRPNTIAQKVSIRRSNGERGGSSIYRLVLMAFKPIQGMKNMEVCHIDGNPANNCLNNLEWRSGSYLGIMRNTRDPFVDFLGYLQPGEVVLPLCDWQIPNIKSNYFVSNIGNVYSISGNANRRIINLKYEIDKDGYHRMQLYMNDGKSKHFPVHRLVLIAFRYRPDYQELLVNHKDCNKSNNYVDPNGILSNDNIEWCTPAYNSNYMIKTETAFNQMRNVDVLNIIDLLNMGVPVKDIALQYNVCVDTIYGIKNGKTYKPLTGGGLQQWQI